MSESLLRLRRMNKEVFRKIDSLRHGQIEEILQFRDYPHTRTEPLVGNGF